MRLTTGLVLASMATLASASVSGVFNGLAAGQTTPELQCKKAQTNFLACALSNDFNSTSNLWIDAPTCYTAAEAALAGCRGGTAYEADGAPGGFPFFPYPSYAVAGGVSKAGQIKAQVLIPSGAEVAPLNKQPNQAKPPKTGLTKLNTMAVTCKSCTKLMQKVLKCALPATVPNGGIAFQVYYDAALACLTTPQDRVLFQICQPQPGTPLVADASNTLSYLIVAPELTMGDIVESCPSVEFSSTAKGGESVKILKSHIIVEQV